MPYASMSALPKESIQEAFPIGSQVFKINVYTKPIDKSWDSLYRSEEDREAGRLFIRPVETFYGSLNEDLRDGNGSNLFIEKIVNGNSNFIYVKLGSSSGTMPIVYAQGIGGVSGTGSLSNIMVGYSATQVSADLIPNGILNGESYVKFDSTEIEQTDKNRFMLLSGGNSLDRFDSNSNADVASWAIFEDRENVDVSILIGTSNNTAVKQELGRICAKRMDCIASVQAGTISDDTTEEILSKELYGYRAPSYVAIYAGYSKVYDKFNDKFVFLPNSIFGASLFARVDNIGNPWDAPAGINRGILPVIDQRKIFVDDEIGRLYDRNINASKFIRGTGFVVWGQKTAQMKSSALDRINVRRTLLFIENNVERSLLPFVFENNTAKTRLRVFSFVDEFLSSVQAGGGVTEYSVVCDDSNNPQSVIDSNRLNVDIYVQPTRTIEFIQLQVIITRTGVSFSEI